MVVVVGVVVVGVVVVVVGCGVVAPDTVKTPQNTPIMNE